MLNLYFQSTSSLRQLIVCSFSPHPRVTLTILITSNILRDNGHFLSDISHHPIHIQQPFDPPIIARTIVPSTHKRFTAFLNIQMTRTSGPAFLATCGAYNRYLQHALTGEARLPRYEQVSIF